MDSDTTRPISRRHLLRLLCTVAICAPAFPLLGVDNEKPRGDRVGWARLKTDSQWWLRHANGDSNLTRFLREQTTLNIDMTWHVADVQNLDEMSRYPLLFSQGIHVVTTSTTQTNVVEYMRRGGFLLVDACCHPGATPSEDLFLQQHIRLLQQILPEAKVELLPPTHPIYHCYFQIPEGRPPHTFYGHVYNQYKASHGLYGILIGKRMAGLITVSGLQCGWSPLGEIPPPPHHDIDCMEMMVNIYVYAMTQGS